MNMVVVTDFDGRDTETGSLVISKTVAGNGIVNENDYLSHFDITVALKNPDGTALSGAYYFYGTDKSGYISDGGEISGGDVITFTDVDGHLFFYTVSEVEVLKEVKFDELNVGEWDLLLFTCTIGRKSRVTVRCKRSTDD